MNQIRKDISKVYNLVDTLNQKFKLNWNVADSQKGSIPFFYYYPPLSILNELENYHINISLSFLVNEMRVDHVQKEILFKLKIQFDGENILKCWFDSTSIFNYQKSLLWQGSLNQVNENLTNEFNFIFILLESKIYSLLVHFENQDNIEFIKQIEIKSFD